MNYRICLKYLGIIYVIIGVSMAVPVGFGVYFREPEIRALLVSMAVAFAVGLTLAVPFYRVKEDVLRKEGFFSKHCLK